MNEHQATLAKIAGWTWLTLGGLMVAVCVFLAIAGKGGWILVVILLLPASVFFYVGSQTVRAKAKDTLGNGIGSLAFGAFALNSAVGKPGALSAENIGALLPSIALLLAGLLALLGRSKYKRWRASQVISAQPGVYGLPPQEVGRSE